MLTLALAIVLALGLELVQEPALSRETNTAMDIGTGICISIYTGMGNRNGIGTGINWQ